MCACPFYEAHLVDEMGTLCGRCEHTLAAHHSVRSSMCLQCSMLLCSHCKRIVHDEPASADSLSAACIDTPSMAGQSPYPSDALSQSSSPASGSQPRACANPHHLTLAAPALAILKAAHARQQATAQLDAFVASSHQSRSPRRESNASSDADSTIPAIPSTDDELLELHDRARARAIGSAVDAMEAVRLSQSYMTLAALLSPSEISSLFAKLRRTEGQYLNELALLPSDDRIVSTFPTSLQLSSGVIVQAASVPLIALSSRVTQSTETTPMHVNTCLSYHSLDSVSFTDSIVSDGGLRVDAMPAPSQPPAHHIRNGDLPASQLTLCPNCALSFQSPLSASASAADGEVLNSPPKVSTRLLPPRSPAPVVRNVRMAAPLVRATLPAEPFRSRSVSETLVVRSFSPALLSRALTSSPAMSSTTDASAFQVSPLRWPHADEPALHDDGSVDADACSSPSVQESSPMFHPPEVLLARSVSFTPRAVHAGACYELISVVELLYFEAAMCSMCAAVVIHR